MQLEECNHQLYESCEMPLGVGPGGREGGGGKGEDREDGRRGENGR